MTFDDRIGDINPGYAEPILWGVKKGYSTAEIAQGLGIEASIVQRVIEAFSPVKFPAIPAPAVPVKAMLCERTDPRYRAWLRAKQGATATIKAMAAAEEWQQ